MSSYISVSIDLDSLADNAVNFHCAHDDGQSSYRIDGNHDPIYLHAKLDGLRRFRDSLETAIDAAEAKALAADQELALRENDEQAVR